MVGISLLNELIKNVEWAMMKILKERIPQRYFYGAFDLSFAFVMSFKFGITNVKLL